jgi:uncharacterized protein
MYSPRQYAFETVTPGGYASLMDLYENNYLRLKKLLPELDDFAGEAVSHIDGCLDLHIALLESSRYTSSYRLTYYFADDNADTLVAEPDLTVRVYHDAGLVEVLAGHLQHGRVRHNHLPADSLRLKWKMNRFLYRWLGYCLHLGHHFPSADVLKSTAQGVK